MEKPLARCSSSTIRARLARQKITSGGSSDSAVMALAVMAWSSSSSCTTATTVTPVPNRPSVSRYSRVVIRGSEPLAGVAGWGMRGPWLRHLGRGLTFEVHHVVVGLLHAAHQEVTDHVHVG